MELCALPSPQGLRLGSKCNRCPTNTCSVLSGRELGHRHALGGGKRAREQGTSKRYERSHGDSKTPPKHCLRSTGRAVAYSLCVLRIWWPRQHGRMGVIIPFSGWDSGLGRTETGPSKVFAGKQLSGCSLAVPLLLPQAPWLPGILNLWFPRLQWKQLFY